MGLKLPVSLLDFLSVGCSVLLVMQSVGKHTRPSCCGNRRYRSRLASKSDLTIFNNKLSKLPRAGDTCPPLLINTSSTTSLYSPLCLFIKRNLFIIILANTSTRWGFIFAFSFLFEGRFEGAIKVQQLADQIVVIPNSQRSLSMRPPPLVPSGKELAGEERKKKKETSSRKEKHLKTFNCNPDAICTPLVKPLNNVTGF